MPETPGQDPHAATHASPSGIFATPGGPPPEPSIETDPLLKSIPTAEGEQALKLGEWNELEVSVHGAHIVTQLNGTKIVDFTDPAPQFRDGVIGLQIHTGGGVKMRWKDIYLKPE